MQLEFNDFIRLEERELFGGGLRVALWKSEGFSLYIGIGVMHENELYTNPDDEDENALRSTNYLSAKYAVNDKVNFFHNLLSG